jgi:hypothetical protein
MWCEKPSNCQLEYTQHGGLTCKSTRRTRRPARLQPACSARRPDRRCVVCTRVACHHPSMVCHLGTPESMWVGRTVPGRFSTSRLGMDYRVDGPIRNSLFLIWAKGEGEVSPSRTPIFKKLSGNEKAI